METKHQSGTMSPFTTTPTMKQTQNFIGLLCSRAELGFCPRAKLIVALLPSRAMFLPPSRVDCCYLTICQIILLCSPIQDHSPIGASSECCLQFSKQNCGKQPSTPLFTLTYLPTSLLATCKQWVALPLLMAIVTLMTYASSSNI